VLVDSLKALDPKRPIREADMAHLRKSSKMAELEKRVRRRKMRAR
jgi:hypothetical protein